MTLREIIAAHPALFYGQVWYEGEPWLDRDALHGTTPRWRNGQRPPAFLPSAATLAYAYVNDPANPVWQRAFWTSDVDRNGWPVFVGWVGLNKPGQFEIHRRVDYSQVGVAIWT